LLQQVTADRVAKKEKGSKEGRAPSNLSRKATAEAAGLSAGQAKQMVRVANVPAEMFEGMVERAKPVAAKIRAKKMSARAAGIAARLT
jgi:hypothetical protein